MTNRLYYTDAYRTEFEAKLLASCTVDDKPGVVLDQSYFYPTSGGQPYDTGVLAGHRVTDVIATKEGQVVHLLETAVDEARIGTVVRGVIDWPRRYDHMQQHSGQHLLSQAFYQCFGYETLSVHFGEKDSTLDLETASISQEQLDQLEDFANGIVYENRPIHATLVEEGEIEAIPLRRPPKVTGEIRIVEIENFDYSACGGTHCRSTAEIGPIKLLRQERQRGQARITFVCGRRANADYATKHRLLREAASSFNTEMVHVPALIVRNLEKLKRYERNLENLTEQLLGYEVEALQQAARPIGRYQVIAQHYRDKEVSHLKSMALQLQENPHTIALLGCIVDEKLTLFFACGSDVSVNMGGLLKNSLSKFGGGGGGRPQFAQGGGVSPSVVEELIADAVSMLHSF